MENFKMPNFEDKTDNEIIDIVANQDKYIRNIVEMAITEAERRGIDIIADQNINDNLTNTNEKRYDYSIYINYISPSIIIAITCLILYNSIFRETHNYYGAEVNIINFIPFSVGFIMGNIIVIVSLMLIEWLFIFKRKIRAYLKNALAVSRRIRVAENPRNFQGDTRIARPSA